MAQPLAIDERYQIFALKKAGYSKAEIARQLRPHPATIGRELARNGGGRGYRPQPAQRQADARKRLRVRPRLGTLAWALIEALQAGGLEPGTSQRSAPGRPRLPGQPRVDLPVHLC